MGFENGNFNGWKLEYGRVYNAPPSTVVTYSNPTQGTLLNGHLITSGTAFDPIVTTAKIPVVAPGSKYSARIGNDINGGYYDRISRIITVTPENSLFLYQFAVVLQNPDPKTHTPAQQPKFIIKVLDPSGNTDDCNNYEVYASTKNSGFKSQGTGNNLIVYRDWTTAALDLRRFLGQTVTISVTSTDCTEGGHYGYAYFSARCFSSKITAKPDCNTKNSLTLTAPAGFEKYTWSTGDTTNPVTIKNPILGSKVTVKIKPFFSISDSCQLALDYTVPNFSNNATFLTQTTCNPADTGTQVQKLTNTTGCDSIVTTRTTLLKGRDTTFLTATTCNPKDAGIAIKRLTNFVGCDSFVQLKTILLKGRDTTSLTATTCNPSDTSTHIKRLTNFVGCDSFVQLKTVLLKGRDTTFISAASCNPSDTGYVFKRLTNFVGCDSFVIVKTKLLKGRDTTFLNAYTCNAADSGVVMLKKFNSNGCDSFIFVRRKYLPLTVNVETVPTDCSGKSGVISVAKTLGGKPPFKYALRDTLSFQTNAQFDSLDTNTYTVFVKDSLNCTSKFDNIVVEGSACNVFVPTAFSPNGDEANDFFMFYATSGFIKTIKNYRIYNRWGILVYEAPTKNVPLEKFRDWWDGTFRKELLSPDVFIYAIEVEYFNSSLTNTLLKGSVTLVR